MVTARGARDLTATRTIVKIEEAATDRERENHLTKEHGQQRQALILSEKRISQEIRSLLKRGSVLPDLNPIQEKATEMVGRISPLAARIMTNNTVEENSSAVKIHLFTNQNLIETAGVKSHIKENEVERFYHQKPLNAIIEFA
jgi:hypothetical protein